MNFTFQSQFSLIRYHRYQSSVCFILFHTVCALYQEFFWAKNNLVNLFQQVQYPLKVRGTRGQFTVMNKSQAPRLQTSNLRYRADRFTLLFPHFIFRAFINDFVIGLSLAIAFIRSITPHAKNFELKRDLKKHTWTNAIL